VSRSIDISRTPGTRPKLFPRRRVNLNIEAAMNIIRRTAMIFATAIFLLASQAPARAQEQEEPQQTKEPGPDDMPGMDMNEMQRDAGSHPDASQSAHEAMSGHHMEMNAHMFMTALRPEDSADDQRAAAIVVTVRNAIEKYKDYRVALADGFQIFHAEVPQQHYHFTNYRYAFEAIFVFNPEHPTSLLYKKTPNGYELEGAMFTARKKATEEELNDRVPLSVARWHKHVNICLPPKGAQPQQASLKQFGFGGSIATEDACNQAGGRWIPRIFNWMVHVYPYETDPKKIWVH
jgi:hypothetical protein